MPTEEQRANLKKLADYLATGQTAMKFDMSDYCRKPIDPKKAKELRVSLSYMDTVFIQNAECGTVACAIGHGPAAGIPSHVNDAGWWDYTSRAFGIQPGHEELDDDLWAWMFSSEWKDTDNTPQGAAARIRWFLDHDCAPDNARQQMLGEAKLCYPVPA